MRSGRSTALLLAAPLAFLGCFFAWPVVNIVGEGLRAEQGGWDLGGVSEVLGDPALRQVAWFTLWQALASTAHKFGLSTNVVYERLEREIGRSAEPAGQKPRQESTTVASAGISRAAAKAADE